MPATTPWPHPHASTSSLPQEGAHCSREHLTKLSGGVTHPFTAEEAKPEPISMDIDAIMKVLPHRYPFLLVDRVTELVSGDYAHGYKNVTVNDNFFPGHFPGRPLMPGVLQVKQRDRTYSRSYVSYTFQIRRNSSPWSTAGVSKRILWGVSPAWWCTERVRPSETT